MSLRDRTREFQLTVRSLQQRVAPRPNSTVQRYDQRSRAQHIQFNEKAALIAKHIQSTAEKLETLGQLTKRKTLFDDQSIHELTHVIKQDIAALNQQITMLSQLRQTGSESQLEQHSSNVITLLQSRLANTSMTFKHVLETRTEQMRHSRDRRQQLTGQDPPISTSSASSSYLMERSDSVTIDIPSQQLAMIPNQYIEERHSAIESIEATIAELGSIFQQLAHMVAEQNDTIQRIEANVDDMEMNISGAQRELLKLYQHVTSNRWLMIRIFIILIIFFFLFVVVM